MAAKEHLTRAGSMMEWSQKKVEVTTTTEGEQACIYEGGESFRI